MSRRRLRVAHRAAELVEALLLAIPLAGVLIGAVGALSLVPQVQFGPPVGEILTFGQYGLLTPRWHVSALRASTNRYCVLKPAVMAVAQASMVVERRTPDGSTFLAHWAGGPTSDDAGNCGNDVELAIQLPAMQLLVGADTHAVHWLFVGM